MTTVRIAGNGSAMTAIFEGDLDVYSVAALKQTLWPVFISATSLALDLRQTTAIDCAGVQLLAWLQAVAQARSVPFEVLQTSEEVTVAAKALCLTSWLRDSVSPSSGSTAEVEQPPTAPGLHQFEVKMRFGASVLRDGMDPVAMLRHLRRCSTVTSLVSTFSMPSDDSFDAECCYLSLHLELAAADRSVIDDTFQFVIDCSELSVQQHSNSAGATASAPPPPAETARAERFIRVSAEKLDALVDLVGELVIGGATAAVHAARLRDVPLIESLSALNTFVEALRERALALRMVPIGESFTRFRRLVRDASHQLGKHIELEIRGGETELDKGMVERLSDPLLHLVRNAIDHGLETPAARRASGKRLGTWCSNLFRNRAGW